MKKSKRLLSLFLAALMAFSSLTAGIYAFADEQPSDYNFAQEVSEFKTVPINRAAIDGEVIWTVEGIQNTVNATWNYIKFMLNMAVEGVNFNNGLNDVLTGFVYQADTVASVFQVYQDLSHDEDYGELFYELFNSAVIADFLTQDDKKFAGAVEKIRAIEVTDEEKAQGINDLDKLVEIEFTDKDFGFKNTDKAGFIDAILAVIRPITYLLSDDCDLYDNIKGFDINMFDAADGSAQGVYSLLIPMLEQLGLNDLPTAVQYKANFDTVRQKQGKNPSYDELVRPIVNSIFANIVQPVADDPLNGVLRLLPRFAFVLDSYLLNDTVQAVLKSTGEMFYEAADSVEITPDMVNEALASTETEYVSNAGQTYTFRLKPIDWAILADCATVAVVPSVSNSNQYVMVRTGDIDSCFTNVFYYIYNLAFADKSNFACLNAMIHDQLSGKTLAEMTKTMNEMAAAGKFGGYRIYLENVGKAGKTPIPREKSDVQKKFIDLGNHVIYDEYVAYTSIYNAFIAGTNPPKYTEFSPTTAITRAMFVAILYRMAGNPYDDANPHKTNPFTDISTDAYYYNAACWALDNKITNQTTFKPYDNVTREQTARFLFAYAEQEGKLGSENYKKVKLSDYPDYSSVATWAIEPLQWANYNNMITGTQQGYINPQGATQRIHATRILYGFGKACKIGNFK